MPQLSRKKLIALIDNQRQILKIYALGALLFFIGLGIIQGADKLMPPSLEQESYALLGILVGGAGFMLAMLCQLALIMHRFRKMGRR